LDWLTTNDKNIDEGMWFKHGGKATVLAYKNITEKKKNEHIVFLKSLKDYYIDDQNRLFIHAGFTNLNGVDYEYFSKMFYWDRTLWETALALDPNIDQSSLYYPKRFKNYFEIYIGHTPTTRINSLIPVQKANVWNIDTGAAFRGKLTILDIETKNFWQSDTLPELYPDEKGRNS
jgi:serine/threonine protein phosphatase 1